MKYFFWVVVNNGEAFSVDNVHLFLLYFIFIVLYDFTSCAKSCKCMHFFFVCLTFMFCMQWNNLTRFYTCIYNVHVQNYTLTHVNGNYTFINYHPIDIWKLTYMHHNCCEPSRPSCSGSHFKWSRCVSLTIRCYLLLLE